VFALGVVAYEMLTGELPFGRGSLADVVLAQARDVRPVAVVDPRVPPALDRVVMQALRMQSDARPASAHEFAAALLQGSGADV
jgi:serine/threonine-protein kinase